MTWPLTWSIRTQAVALIEGGGGTGGASAQASAGSNKSSAAKENLKMDLDTWTTGAAGRGGGCQF